MANRRGILFWLGLVSLGAVGVAASDGDGDRNGTRSGWLTSRADVAPVTNATYGEECGSCHLAYQPGLLPAQAWTQVMDPAALADHYGDDASLTETLRAEIAGYLLAQAADQASAPRSRAFAVGFDAHAGTGLPRITERRYFERKHDDVPASLVTSNPDVGSFSQCNACHRGAAKGVYNDSRIDIPGYGRWED
ncbi:diheme cytochrome c [Thiococcus pfennigii]|uniref:diheme cytochrome c n=1 Tax=Thiococcus pfennigii TaxID=1057 RepID=UPI00190495CB|nr:diheme cytochrome c [Thiococcus pfennigii]MBK1730966.1 cytochrome C [Thiococcus pfennigii]